MIRFTFLFIFAIQIASVVLFGVFVWALVFHPEAIGAAVAKIIVGFQQTMAGAA
ncbi:hypothetical protein [Rhizobium rhizogenes]|uniref:hypothetical protein n=1 Tax=Rhizobium rhizogenes TaxID=359 RepID=UPI0024BEBF95|nr:hypothetical protein [Rhizobium rhizogenes]MDJ1632296.1 hypothetical protein [Rhizobium rhizogenes]